MALQTMKNRTHRGSGANGGLRALRLNRADALILFSIIEYGMGNIEFSPSQEQLKRVRTIVAKYRSNFNIKG